jgi:hypothetical protein
MPGHAAEAPGVIASSIWHCVLPETRSSGHIPGWHARAAATLNKTVCACHSCNACTRYVQARLNN